MRAYDVSVMTLGRRIYIDKKTALLLTLSPPPSDAKNYQSEKINHFNKPKMSLSTLCWLNHIEPTSSGCWSDCKEIKTDMDDDLRALKKTRQNLARHSSRARQNYTSDWSILRILCLKFPTELSLIVLNFKNSSERRDVFNDAREKLAQSKSRFDKNSFPVMHPGVINYACHDDMFVFEWHFWKDDNDELIHVIWEMRKMECGRNCMTKYSQIRHRNISCAPFHLIAKHHIF
jgi:hypothetical protein